jgi:hypothetical protein
MSEALNPATPAPKRQYTRKLKVYIVTDSSGTERLVRAYTPADALRHVTPTFHVVPAEQDDIIALMASGATVETAGATTITAPAAPGLTD